VDRITVVGVGADGWAGLTEPARAAVGAAEVVLGGTRQLDLVAGHTKAEPRPWPSPMLPALPGMFAELSGLRVCVLASGDPMLHGIGATLARVLGPERLDVVAHPSSASLACARLGWALDAVEIVSAVARPLARVRRLLAPGARLLVLSEDGTTPAALAALLGTAARA
jgi:precorrin-6Y C5,15-methyltransferase (decarboxylating)